MNNGSSVHQQQKNRGSCLTFKARLSPQRRAGPDLGQPQKLADTLTPVHFSFRLRRHNTLYGKFFPPSSMWMEYVPLSATEASIMSCGKSGNFKWAGDEGWFSKERLEGWSLDAFFSFRCVRTAKNPAAHFDKTSFHSHEKSCKYSRCSLRWNPNSKFCKCKKKATKQFICNICHWSLNKSPWLYLFEELKCDFMGHICIYLVLYWLSFLKGMIGMAKNKITI